jgi:hypothetical protein
MKSTPEQTSKRHELARLVDALGDIAWRSYPEVAEVGIVASKDSESTLDVVDYDEFFVVQHETTTIPAKETGGKIFLRFRRRVTRDRKHAMLWHFWEPSYAATKPEMVDEMLPVIRAHLCSLQGRKLEP